MIIASIDLMGGKAVQLKQGREKILERDRPEELARDFDRYGEIAVIDLDQAMQTGDNTDVIKPLLKLGDCRVGGGIRSMEKAKQWIALGAKKVILGSAVFENDQLNIPLLEQVSNAVGKEQIIVAVDARHEKIVTRGWTHQTGLDLYAAAQVIQNYASELLFTCVEREGTMTGIDLDQVRRLDEAVTIKITAAGGVRQLDEIRQLSALGIDIQLGMALYTGAIRLDDAFMAGLNWNSGLIPTITQDQTGQVLTLAYSSPESLHKVFETGRMWFFSRSRRKLWMKGEQSGHTQEVLRLRADCDRDSLLVTVCPQGPACHTNQYSCFGYKNFAWEDLLDVIRDRLENPSPNSYTAKLDDKLLRLKIMEEAEEVCDAQKRDDIIWEAADVLYFLSVLLVKNKIGVQDVLHELNRRRKK
ncbi:MAG: phosphoribosyl-ATP diphosphatase [Candidatus Delongbacteria bacterium]|nr:phosphoribosyl-ATP diphosphatase [Candidatus Delongbacteria bacterium]